jgi:hypothetical protein
VKLVGGIRRVADRHGRLKARAIASTGPSGKAAQSSLDALALGEHRTLPLKGPITCFTSNSSMS